ncbi:hypothetical protein ABPG74_018889 [Tetrahymena malaccensis]
MIDDIDFSDITQALENCVNISNLQLHFGNDEFNDENLILLSKSLENMNLYSLILYIRFSAISNYGVSALGYSLKELPYLSNLTLDLYNNKIKSQGLSDLWSILQRQNQLQSFTLKLAYNSITSEDLIDSIQGFEIITNTSTLNLNFLNNQIYDGGLKRLASFIELFSNLSILELQLDFYLYSCDIQKELFTSLKKCSKLSYLNLGLFSHEVNYSSLYFGIKDLIQVVVLILNQQFPVNFNTYLWRANIFKQKKLVKFSLMN